MNNAVTLHIPATVTMPRGAAWAAAFFAATARAIHTLWEAMADDEQGSYGRDAAELRRFAASLAKSEPSFAADLYAAADRHLERGSAFK